MWHPNGELSISRLFRILTRVSIVYPDGNVCISILVRFTAFFEYSANTDFVKSTRPVRTSTDTKTLESDGFLCIRLSLSCVQSTFATCIPTCLISSRLQLLSVVSMLSAERPNTDSPANVDAAKEVRENFECTSDPRRTLSI